MSALSPVRVGIKNTRIPSAAKIRDVVVMWVEKNRLSGVVLEKLEPNMLLSSNGSYEGM
jgi:hypothetical protein